MATRRQRDAREVEESIRLKEEVDDATRNVARKASAAVEPEYGKIAEKMASEVMKFKRVKKASIWDPDSSFGTIHLPPAFKLLSDGERIIWCANRLHDEFETLRLTYERFVSIYYGEEDGNVLDWLYASYVRLGVVCAAHNLALGEMLHNKLSGDKSKAPVKLKSAARKYARAVWVQTSNIAYNLAVMSDWICNREQFLIDAALAEQIQEAEKSGDPERIEKIRRLKKYAGFAAEPVVTDKDDEILVPSDLLSGADDDEDRASTSPRRPEAMPRFYPDAYVRFRMRSIRTYNDVAIALTATLQRAATKIRDFTRGFDTENLEWCLYIVRLYDNFLAALQKIEDAGGMHRVPDREYVQKAIDDWKEVEGSVSADELQECRDAVYNLNAILESHQHFMPTLLDAIVLLGFASFVEVIYEFDFDEYKAAINNAELYAQELPAPYNGDYIDMYDGRQYMIDMTAMAEYKEFVKSETGRLLLKECVPEFCNKAVRFFLVKEINGYKMFDDVRQVPLPSALR